MSIVSFAKKAAKKAVATVKKVVTPVAKKVSNTYTAVDKKVGGVLPGGYVAPKPSPAQTLMTTRTNPTPSATTNMKTDKSGKVKSPNVIDKVKEVLTTDITPKQILEAGVGAIAAFDKATTIPGTEDMIKGTVPISPAGGANAFLGMLKGGKAGSLEDVMKAAGKGDLQHLGGAGEWIKASEAFAINQKAKVGQTARTMFEDFLARTAPSAGNKAGKMSWGESKRIISNSVKEKFTVSFLTDAVTSVNAKMIAGGAVGLIGGAVFITPWAKETETNAAFNLGEARKLASEAGDEQLAAEISQKIDELTNPNFYGQVLDNFPYVNLVHAANEVMKSLRTRNEAMKKLDEAKAKGTDPWSIIEAKNAEDDARKAAEIQKSIDDAAERDRIKKEEIAAAIKDADKRQAAEDKIWKDRLAEQKKLDLEKERYYAEIAERNAKIWADKVKYYEDLQKEYEKNTPSKLGFGLL